MDPRLHPFLEAVTRTDADAELTRLMELATPSILSVVRHRAYGGKECEAEDVVSEARTQIVGCLQRMREDGGRSPRGASIADFETYVRTMAYNIWAETLRRENPERSKLQNRLHYLLAKRSTQYGFGLWMTDDGGPWAGFECWRGTIPETFSSERHLRLLTAAQAAATDACGAVDWSSLNLPDLVAALLSWLGGPLKLSDLVNAVLRLQKVTAPVEVLAPDEADFALVDPDFSPSEALRWKEYLSWLWQQTAQLTLPQRCAFWLHSHCLHELEFAGLASVRQAASALGLAAERMAELWNALPIDDLTIGGLLGVDRQQVINWRKAARIRLGRAWQAWSNQK